MADPVEYSIWVPQYKKGVPGLVRWLYRFLLVGKGEGGFDATTFAFMALTLNPGALTAAYITAPLALWSVLEAFWPQGPTAGFRSEFPLLIWGSLLFNFFLLLVHYANRLEAPFTSLKTQQRWIIMRLELLLSGVVSILWGVAWLTDRYWIHERYLPFLYDILGHPWYGWGAVALGSLRLLALMSWVLAVEYRDETRKSLPWEEGGRKEGESEPELKEPGVVKPGRVDPQEASRPPDPKEREILLYELRQSLVLPPEAEEEVVDLILLLRHHEAYRKRFGDDMPKGVLLVGPPGTGKTSIARFIAEKSGLSFVAATPGELRSKWLGESAKLIAALFQRARSLAPAVVFIDELEAIAPKRGGHQEVDHSVGQLLQELDGIRADEAKAPVFFMGATNYPDNIDAAVLSRIGSFLNIPRPGEKERERILAILLGEHGVGVDLAAVAKATSFFSGRDLKTLVTRASRKAFLRPDQKLTTESLLEEVALMRGKRL